LLDQAQRAAALAMNAQNIVCFAKDWTEDPTSNNHVMRLLARDNRVLWLNSISTRTPNFSSGRDLGKIARKLASFTKGPVEAAPGLWVSTPIVLPFPHLPAATAINKQVLRGTVSLLRRRLGMRDFQLWSFLPTAAEYVGTLGERLSIYYCTDEWSEFSYVDKEKVAAQEKSLCERADLVFVTSHALLESKRVWNRETHLALHGVDQAHFARSLEPGTQIAEELEGIQGPVLGFVGLVEDWVDIDLLAWLAGKRPNWTIAVVGRAKADVSRLEGLGNVRLLGRKPYEELPRYCRAFSVGLIPFRTNRLTKNVNPIKLREYLSAGLPVVASGVPEVKHYPGWCRFAETNEEFLEGVEAALAEDSPEKRRARSESMKAETWERKVGALSQLVEKAAARK
jgi:glycosyltransferase involved in cell wall biosynthesis